MTDSPHRTGRAGWTAIEESTTRNRLLDHAGRRESARRRAGFVELARGYLTAPRLRAPIVALGLLAATLAGCADADPDRTERAQVKVVTVVAFQDLSALDRPDSGEAYWWYTAGGLSTPFDNPGGYAPLFGSPSGEQLLLIVGPGKSNAGTSVMALGMNPRFDLTHAYWVHAGISGANPQTSTIGAAVWEHWIVDGEIAAVIDPRQLEQRYFAFEVGCTVPPFCGQAFRTGTELFELNEALRDRAVEISSTVVLDDPPSVAALRKPYPQPAARASASVQRGDLFTGDSFVYGSLLSGQMSWWVDSATRGRGTYTVGANEEAGVATALTRLDRAGLADFRRYAVVRSPSNFDQEYRGQTALAGLELASGGGQPEGETVAFRNAYLAASAVTSAILSDWPRWSGGLGD